MWKAHKYITGDPSDGSASKTMVLFFNTFFPDIGEYQKPPSNYKYPRQKFEFKDVTDNQVHGAIKRQIVPIIAPLYRATFRLQYFPQEWKDSTIIVLRKPGKADYAEPNAYRPIALLDTIGKVQHSLDADRERQQQMLCSTQSLS